MTVHRVKKGETLSSIAKLYNTAVKVIENDNGISDIYVGARLVIRSGIKIHVVRPFEKLENVARQYGVTEELVKEVNNLKNNAVYTGQQIVIPSGEGKA